MKCEVSFLIQILTLRVQYVSSFPSLSLVTVPPPPLNSPSHKESRGLFDEPRRDNDRDDNLFEE